jgi:hypothetical protein
MPVPVVDEVGVVAVTHGDMTAVRTVFMVMARVGRVGIVCALVPMVVMQSVGMAVMQVVGVVAVGDGNMAAPFAVDVLVLLMRDMGRRHDAPTSVSSITKPVVRWPSAPLMLNLLP